MSEEPSHPNKQPKHETKSSDAIPSPIYATVHDQGPQGNPYPPPTEAAATATTVPAPVMPPRKRGKHEPPHAPQAAELYNHVQQPQTTSSSDSEVDPGLIAGGGLGGNHYAPSTGVPRLPPILQVEKQQVTTSATQMASASRRRSEAQFVCPVPGCGSTFTRRFNLRGHLRSHTEERPYVCEVCKKGFARQHDCKRHRALHATKSQANVCQGCKRPFSRLDALNRHLRSEGGTVCRTAMDRSRGREAEEWENDQTRQ